MAKISPTPVRRETISPKAQRGVFWAPWAVWVDAEMGVPLPGPGLAHCAPTGQCHEAPEQGWLCPTSRQLPTFNCLYPGGCDLSKENTKNKSQQFLDLASVLSAHQTVPMRSCCRKSISFCTVTRRNQCCCSLPLQTHPNITLVNQLWNKSCDTYHHTVLRIMQYKNLCCCNSIEY